MEDRIREIRKGLLRWYDFTRGSRILYMGSRQEAIGELLTETVAEAHITCAPWQETLLPDWVEKNAGTFDYVISITDLEKVRNR